MPPTLPLNENRSNNVSIVRPLTYSFKMMTGDVLVRSCQSGERFAFDELIRRYKDRIFNLAYSLTQDRDEAEDVAATAYFRIYKGIGTCKHSSALSAWINIIVRNVWLNTLRYRRSRPEVSLDILDTVSRDSLPAECGDVSIHLQAEQIERKEILANAIATLPNFQGRIVSLFYSDERTYEEITEIMGIPVGTVKSRLSRAKYALRRSLAHQTTVLID